MGEGEYEQQQLISDAGYIGAATVLSVIGIVGFLFNACVIFIILRDSQLWTPQNIIIFNLTLSDFAISIFGNPITLTAAISKKWIFGQTVCVAYGFFMGLLGIGSITTLSVLAYDRYLMICYPFSSSRLKKDTVLYAIIGIWFYAFAVTAPPLFGWNHYVNESANISCSIDWESGEHKNYVVYIFFFGLFVPLTVITYSYVRLAITVRKRAAQNVVRQATKAECRVAIMVAVMILAFMVAWMPYAVLALLVAFGNIRFSPAVSIIPALCAKSSICWNPVIYIGLNTQFRSAWKRFFSKPEISPECGLVDCHVATGVSKFTATVQQQETAHSAPNNARADSHSALVCCLIENEFCRKANRERDECNIQMTTSNVQDNLNEPEIGDVSL